MRMLIDLMVGCIFLGAILTLMFLPDIGRYAKRAFWLVADVLFHLAVTGIMACINGWERLMDTYWRIRCRVLGVPVRPY